MLPSSLPEKILLLGTCTAYGTFPGQRWQKAVLSCQRLLVPGALAASLAPFLAAPSLHMVMYGDDTHSGVCPHPCSLRASDGSSRLARME